MTPNATPMYSTVTSAIVSSVARGRVRLTSRNSADRCAMASQPAKAKNSTMTAWPIPDTPCGANGLNRTAWNCGMAAAMTTMRITATPIASPIWRRALSLSPARLARAAAASTPAAMTGAQPWLRPAASHT